MSDRHHGYKESEGTKRSRAQVQRQCIGIGKTEDFDVESNQEEVGRLKGE